MMQKDWDLPLVNVQKVEVLSAASDQSPAAASRRAFHFIVAAVPHSGAFLQMFHCSALGTQLDYSSMCDAVGLRLHVPICIPRDCI